MRSEESKKEGRGEESCIERLVVVVVLVKAGRYGGPRRRPVAIRTVCRGNGNRMRDWNV